MPYFRHSVTDIKLILGDAVYMFCMWVFIFRLFANRLIMCLMLCSISCMKECLETLNMKCLCALGFLDTLSAQNQAGRFLSCGTCWLSYIISVYGKGWNIRCTLYSILRLWQSVSISSCMYWSSHSCFVLRIIRTHL